MNEYWIRQADSVQRTDHRVLETDQLQMTHVYVCLSNAEIKKDFSIRILNWTTIRSSDPSNHHVTFAIVTATVSWRNLPCHGGGRADSPNYFIESFNERRSQLSNRIIKHIHREENEWDRTSRWITIKREYNNCWFTRTLNMAVSVGCFYVAIAIRNYRGQSKQKKKLICCLQKTGK